MNQSISPTESVESVPTAPTVAEPEAVSQPASSKSEAPPVFSDGFTFRKDWYQDYAEDPGFKPYLNSLSKYKDLPGLIKVAEDSRRQLSQRMDGYIKVPGEDAPDEEVAAYRERMGIPEAHDDYEFSLPEGVAIPNGMEVTAERQEAFAEFAHEAGLSQEQADRAFGFILENELRDYEQMQGEQQQLLAADRNELQEVWGRDYESRMHDARRIASSYGIDPSDPVLEMPRIAMAFAAIASSISESKLTNVPTQNSTLSYASQAKDIIQNESNPDHEAYHDRTHPQHNATVEKVLELQKKEVEGRK